MKFNLLCIDCPFSFNDKLAMSDIKRGAQANYPVLNLEEIKKLDIPSLSADNALLALWVPSSMLQDGLDIMTAWGFTQKQTWIWGKIKKQPLFNLKKQIKKLAKNKQVSLQDVCNTIDSFDVNDIFSMYLGRLFRQCHELALIGTKGKIYDQLFDKSQRSVSLDVNLKHSAKPEALQDRLDLMFPDKSLKRLEVFGRRERAGWTVIGNEAQSTYGEDIRDSILNLRRQ